MLINFWVIAPLGSTQVAITSRLRWIRPPQSQFGPNYFLKISVCADGSQHIHKTNKINSFYTKSLRKLFLDDIFCVVFWEFFHVWKPCFWIFIKKNFLVTEILKCITVKKKCTDITNKILLKRSWSNRKYNFHVPGTNNNRLFDRIFFSVINRLPPNTI